MRPSAIAPQGFDWAAVAVLVAFLAVLSLPSFGPLASSLR